MWTMPLGLPVLPLVYRTKRVSSASMGTLGKQAFRERSASTSRHQRSRRSRMVVAVLVRLTTITRRMEGQSFRASSMFAFRGMTRPERNRPSAVMATLASLS